MKTKLAANLLLFLLLTFSAVAQDTTQTANTNSVVTRPYKTAIGFQLTGIGSAIFNPKGLSIKHFISSRSAMEFNLTPGGRNIISSNLTLQRHFQVYDAPQLQWYAGAGVGFEVYRFPQGPNAPDPTKSVVANTTTLLGVLGVEYRFAKMPVSVSGDLKKGFLGFTHRGADNRYNLINGLRPSISFRYTFNNQG